MAMQSIRRVSIAVACAASAGLLACSARAAETEAAPSSAARSMAKDIEWSLRAPKEERVVFQGAVSFDAAGGSGAAPMVTLFGEGGLTCEGAADGAKAIDASSIANNNARTWLNVNTL